MKEKTKKIIGSIIPFAIIELFFGIFLFFIIYTKFIESEEIPIWFFIIMITYLIICITCLIVALVSRIKEINSGEEEKAKKY